MDDDVDRAQAILEGRCQECGWKSAHSMGCKENICRTPIQLDLFSEHYFLDDYRAYVPKRTKHL